MTRLQSLLLATSLSFVPFVSNAATIYPHTYADTYCSLRDLGVDRDEARVAAVREAFNAEGVETYVTLDGDKVGMSTIKAIRVVQNICPQHL